MVNNIKNKKISNINQIKNLFILMMKAINLTTLLSLVVKFLIKKNTLNKIIKVHEILK